MNDQLIRAFEGEVQDAIKCLARAQRRLAEEPTSDQRKLVEAAELRLKKAQRRLAELTR